MPCGEVPRVAGARARAWRRLPPACRVAACPSLTARWPPASARVWVRLAVALAGGLTAAIGRDLRPQRTSEPVDLRLDLGGRVGILMAELAKKSAIRLSPIRTAPAWVICSAFRLSWQSWASAAKTASLVARCPNTSAVGKAAGKA